MSEAKKGETLEMKNMLSYVHGTSFFHALNPLTKLGWALVFGIASFMSTNLYYILALLLITLGVMVTSRVAYESLPFLKALAMIGLVLMLIQLLFPTEGQVYWSIGKIVITDQGLHGALLLTLRLFAALTPLSLMIMLTPMTDLCAALVQKIKVPYKYAFAVMMSLRFIPMFIRQMDQIIQAQSCRGHAIDTKNPFKKVKEVVPLCVPLLVASVKKIDTMAVSIEVRGFGQDARSSYKDLSFHPRDFLFLLFLIVAFALGIVF